MADLYNLSIFLLLTGCLGMACYLAIHVINWAFKEPRIRFPVVFGCLMIFGILGALISGGGK